MELLPLKQQSLKQVAEQLKSGGVVIFPTDTVYGFLADAFNKRAVEMVYRLKKRPKSKPLSLFVKNLTMAKELAVINAKQAKTLKKRWPGAYTFILNRKSGQPLYGLDKKTVALRIPDYKSLASVLRAVNRPLVQTSVNISGRAPIEKISGIIEQFTRANILIVDGGDIKKGKPSKIINLIDNTVVRT